MTLPGLPPLGPGSLPAEIRSAPRETQRRYAAALGFERQLVGQLAKQLASSVERSAGPRQDLVTSGLTDAVMQGGLGVARTLLPRDLR
jgi:hypothetical protein